MSKLLSVLVIGAILGAMTIKTVEYLNFEIPTPVAKLVDGAVYQGDMIDGVIAGQGRMRWGNGDRYEGNFENGLFHGQGKFDEVDGSSYEGEYSQGAATGTGTMIYSEDQQYTGEFLFGRMHGKGVFKSHGTLYEGEFLNNEFNGEGKYTDEYGNTYTGKFLNGMFQGEGAYTGTDGRRYAGEFVNWKMTGQGTYRDSKGTHYEGGFEDWIYHREGRLTDDKGNVFTGRFEDGELNGEGSYAGKNGATYEGKFESGMYAGTGKYTSPKGDVYEGGFSYGRYHGKGRLTYAIPQDNVKQLSGTWQYGDLVQGDDEGLIISPDLINETVLYNQQELLEKSWAKLEPNNPDKIDLYFLGISGDGSQAVFRREIQFVQDYFDKLLKTERKSLTLINARKTIKQIPLATTTSIKSTLKQISQRMDAENDILFIYMSSHGSREFEFSLNQSKMDLPDISAQTLADIINDLPIRWKVIVVSACYSGGFIPPLKNDNTLIITAAAPKQTSFGCSNEADFTYFGEAYFKDALGQTSNFVEAYDLALKIVTEREKSQGYDPSRPQIHKPDAILKQLEQWRLGLALK